MKHYFFNIISLVNNGINRMNAISPTTKKKNIWIFLKKRKTNDKRLNTGTHSSSFHFVRPFFSQTGGYRPAPKSVNRRNADITATRFWLSSQNALSQYYILKSVSFNTNECYNYFICRSNGKCAMWNFFFIYLFF